MNQFLTESVLLTLLALVLAIGLVLVVLPGSNALAGKQFTALSGKVRAGMRSGWLRNTLVTGQFVVSISIIIATIVAHQQLRFMQNKKVGFDKEQVLVVHDTQVLGSKISALKDELATLTSVENVAFAEPYE